MPPTATTSLRLPGHGPFPRLDDHLVQPEVTRDEIIGGVRVVAVPVEFPHATQQSRLNYLVRAHIVPGYRVALELLTRFDEASDFTTDVCVFKDGNDPATGGRFLEEMAFWPLHRQRPVETSLRLLRMSVSLRRRWTPSKPRSRPVAGTPLDRSNFDPPGLGLSLQERTSFFWTRVYLEDILEAAQKIRLYTEGLSYQSFRKVLKNDRRRCSESRDHR